MQYRMTSRRRKPRGNSTPRGEKQAGSPPTLHERDESADSWQADEPPAQRVAKAVAEDIERDVVDSDRGPVMNETYERVRSSDDCDNKFSP